jgi:hypothetical protein
VERTGTRRKRAPVRPSRIGWGYFWAAILLGLSFGVASVAVHEALLAGDWIWMGLFIAGGLTAAGLYFWIVHLWVNCLFD